jgi:hypothetical protein
MDAEAEALGGRSIARKERRPKAAAQSVSPSESTSRAMVGRAPLQLRRAAPEGIRGRGEEWPQGHPQASFDGRGRVLKEGEGAASNEAHGRVVRDRRMVLDTRKAPRPSLQPSNLRLKPRRLAPRGSQASHRRHIRSCPRPGARASAALPAVG